MSQCLYCTYLGLRAGPEGTETVKVFMPHDMAVDVYVCARHKAEKSIDEIRDAFLSLAAHAKTAATAPSVGFAAYPCQCAQPVQSTAMWTCAQCGGRMRP